jgi:beta-aspartyl-peptidase (threonine type)
MSMKNYSLKKAARTVIREDLKNIKGRGGLIAVDSKGNISFQFNTSGMFRAGIDKNGTKTLEIYKLEPEK